MPVNSLNQGYWSDLVDALEKDAQGVPLLPTAGDFFPDGESVAALDELIAALPQTDRETVERNAQLGSGNDWPLRRYALVRLADASDAAPFAQRDILRLDASRPLYYIGTIGLSEAVRMRRDGRLSAWRDIPGRRMSRALDDVGLREVLGIYLYESDHELERRPEPGGETTALPPRYRQIGVPPHPRRDGLPAPIIRRDQTVVHAVPGLNLAQAWDIQLADLVECYDWGGHYDLPGKPRK